MMPGSRAETPIWDRMCCFIMIKAMTAMMKDDEG